MTVGILVNASRSVHNSHWITQNIHIFADHSWRTLEMSHVLPSTFRGTEKIHVIFINPIRLTKCDRFSVREDSTWAMSPVSYSPIVSSERFYIKKCTVQEHSTSITPLQMGSLPIRSHDCGWRRFWSERPLH